MKSLLLIALSILFISVNAQKSINVIFKTRDGRIITQDANEYTIHPFIIQGLTSETEFAELEKIIKKDPNVSKIEFIGDIFETNKRKCTIIVKDNSDDKLFSLLRSMNVNQLIINDRTFNLDQKEEIKAYIKELKESTKLRRAIPDKKKAQE